MSVQHNSTSGHAHGHNLREIDIFHHHSGIEKVLHQTTVSVIHKETQWDKTLVMASALTVVSVLQSCFVGLLA
jgi:hypothetical protein